MRKTQSWNQHRSFFGLLGIKLLIVPIHAQAASHDISACLWIEDDRFFREFIGGEYPIDTYGESIPLVDLPVRIEYELAGVKIPAIGSVTTGEDGCFSAELSGLAVPHNTQIHLSTPLSNSEFRVYEAGQGTIHVQWGSRSVSRSSPNARFGTITASSIDSRGEPTNTPLYHWANSQTLKSQYSRYVQPWSDADFKQLDIQWPAPEGTGGGLATGGMKITFSEGVRSNFAYFFHEWGHWMTQNQFDMNRGDRPGYCHDQVSSRFPRSLVPYLYWDPDSVRSGGDEEDCTHSYDNPEAPEMAFIEGIADFIAATLFFDGQCKSEVFEARPLTFDGNDNERSIQSTLCDLRDSGNETQTALHVYREEGAIREVASGSERVPYPRASAQDASGNRFVGAEVGSASVLEMDLAASFSSSGTYQRISFADLLEGDETIIAVAVSADWLCAASGQRIACQHQRGLLLGSRFQLPLVTRAPGIIDLKLVDNRLYALIEDYASDEFQVRSFDLEMKSALRVVGAATSFGGNTSSTAAPQQSPLQTLEISAFWSEPIWSEPASERETTEYLRAKRPVSLAVDASSTQKRLWIARATAVDSCVLTTSTGVGGVTAESCVAPMALTAGSDSEKGYVRGGSALNARFIGISQIRMGSDPAWSGARLMVQDRRGLAVLRPSAVPGRFTSEQYLAPGMDHVFLNNLSLRSLRLSSPEDTSTFWFGSNGVDRALLIANSVADWTPQRMGDYDRRWLWIDLSKSETQAIYCGQENLRVSNQTLLHGSSRHPYYTNLTDYLSEVVGLSSSESSAVREVNFAKLNTTGCDRDAYRGAESTRLEGSLVIQSTGPMVSLSQAPADKKGLTLRSDPRLFVRHSARDYRQWEQALNEVKPPLSQLSSRRVEVSVRDVRRPPLPTRIRVRSQIPKARLSQGVAPR